MADILHNLDELAPIGPLTDWLDAHVPELGKGPLRTAVLSGGTSNVVLTLSRGEKPMVLRRPPAVPPPGRGEGRAARGADSDRAQPDRRAAPALLRRLRGSRR